MSVAVAKARLAPVRRGSSQSRLSAVPVAQMEARDRFHGMQRWPTENLHVRVTVADLADLGGMRPPNGTRRDDGRNPRRPAGSAGSASLRVRGDPE